MSAMTWHETEDVEQWLAAVGHLLLPHPVRHTVALTQVERVRNGAGDTRFAWWQRPSAVTGAAMWSGPHPALLCVVPDEAVAPLMQRWQPSRVSGPTALAVQAAALVGRAELVSAQRLFRLGTLVTPQVPGAARTAEGDDAELLVAWSQAFAEEAGTGDLDIEAMVQERLALRSFVLWDDGGPRALAGHNHTAFGVTRVGPVYTPPEHPGRGYGGAATAAVSQRVQVHGDVVLFTDLTNPTSNALYPRLGYVPVEDRAVLRMSGFPVSPD
jgi:predicted GNAT family acetyltransferase